MNHLENTDGPLVMGRIGSAMLLLLNIYAQR
jgi:hypothetical protein